MLNQQARSVLLRLVRIKFGEYQQDGNELKVNCPWCTQRGRRDPDTKRKLWINIKVGLYHCWRCDAGGSVSVLFPQLASEFHAPAVEERKVEVEKQALEPLPTELYPLTSLPQNHLVHEYLRLERNTTIDEIAPYGVFCPDYKRPHPNGYVQSFGPRIVFPIYQGGKYKGFQGRTIWRNTEPKYVGALGMEKKKLIWNYDKAVRGSRIILVEGVFDAIRLGDEGAAIFGKSISEDQIRLLQLGDFRQVIVWLDQDAQTYCEDTARRLAPYFPSYMLVTNRFKDAGETPRNIIQEIVASSIKRVY